MSRYVAPAPEAVDAFLAAHPRWSRSGVGLACMMQTSDFAESLALAVRIGCLAEKHDHHPDLDVRWGKLHVFWSTHDTGGLSTLDLQLASATDAILPR
jgi:4a-hydroxytetrahydrobiopterin dehydratase